MRILIVAPSWIGDTILAQPLFKRLHARHHALELDVLAPAWTRALLTRMPEVREVLENPFAHGEFNLGARWHLGRALRSRQYDEAIILPNSWKSALVPFFAGIPQRTGFTGEARAGLLNQRHRLDSERHPQLAQRYACLAEPPSATAVVTPATELHAELTSTPEQQQAARAALGLPADALPVVFCPGAEYGPAKRWPARHFATLAKHLGRQGTPVWLLGSHKDAELGAQIAQLAEGSALNLCGRSNLEQAIDLIASAQRVVSNDSGLMHITAALNRPLWALYGSSSPLYTPPLSSQARIISTHADCSPCFKRICPLGHFKCMEQLTPELLLNEFTR